MDKVIFETPSEFLKIKSAETTPYFYVERKGIDSVAFILFDENRDEYFGVTNERKPPMDERFGELAFIETAFGGSNDIIDYSVYSAMNENEIVENMREIVKIEAKEEAGYTVDSKHIQFISKEFVSTQMNQWVYLFLVDVSGLSQGKTEPQNATEAMATVVWKNTKQVQKMSDWKTKTIVFNVLAV
jgi:hypothetical protein